IPFFWDKNDALQVPTDGGTVNIAITLTWRK
ncbi:hypothetical protein A2U01_0076955, partial [Trifolium medium]|nr:hypothetical protein [Trifolium medium]